jgi:hypothetical protein
VYFFSAKVRLNEISTSLQFAKKQWIELFVGSGDILDNKVLVHLKSSATDSESEVLATSVIFESR